MLSRKEYLITERRKSIVVYMEIILLYNTNPDLRIGVVEGVDDLNYYSSVFRKFSIGHKLFSSEGKENVLQVYEKLDWKVYSKNRILFFVDRDVDEILNRKFPLEQNIYITDKYAIENNVCTEEGLLRSLEVAYQKFEIKDKNKIKLLEMFRDAIDCQNEYLKEMMAWIVFWDEAGKKANLRNINLRKFYDIREGVFVEIIGLGEVYKETLHKQCNVELEEIDIMDYVERIDTAGGMKKFIRGKFLLTFFFLFIKSLSESWNILFPDEEKMKMVIEVKEKNIVPLLSGYIDPPLSLVSFLKKNLVIN